MAMPPVPPQPPGPPGGTPPPGGGFGPPPEGFGPPSGGGYGSGGYGPPYEGNGSGGYGPPPGGGNWLPPEQPGQPGDPGGHRGPGRRPSPLLILIAAIVVLGAVVAVVLLASGGDAPEKNPPESSQSSSGTPEPSFSLPTELPTKLPTKLPTELPSGFPTELPTEFPTDLPSEFPSDLESLIPLSGEEVPYYMLRTGDCFDTDTSHPGQAAKRACDGPHDAEVVKVAELEGSHSTDAALKKAASTLCRSPLERAAAEQPVGTVRGSLVQYPDTASYRLGIDKVACSLAADLGSGTRKLTAPLT
uniref:Septum formation-related domain-containing protein n=1 Tax=Streptomyces sp. NBC_00093 TaxID=2975649 RepID=A0AAU2AD06_9ACTN